MKSIEQDIVCALLPLVMGNRSSYTMPFIRFLEQSTGNDRITFDQWNRYVGSNYVYHKYSHLSTVIMLSTVYDMKVVFVCNERVVMPSVRVVLLRIACDHICAVAFLLTCCVYRLLVVDDYCYYYYC
jgi:hypothetical protein